MKTQYYSDLICMILFCFKWHQNVKIIIQNESITMIIISEVLIGFLWLVIIRINLNSFAVLSSKCPTTAKPLISCLILFYKVNSSVSKFCCDNLCSDCCEIQTNVDQWLHNLYPNCLIINVSRFNYLLNFGIFDHIAFIATWGCRDYFPW